MIELGGGFLARPPEGSSRLVFLQFSGFFSVTTHWSAHLWEPLTLRVRAVGLAVFSVFSYFIASAGGSHFGSLAVKSFNRFFRSAWLAQSPLLLCVAG